MIWSCLRYMPTKRYRKLPDPGKAQTCAIMCRAMRTKCLNIRSHAIYPCMTEESNDCMRTVMRNIQLVQSFKGMRGMLEGWRTLVG